MNDPTPSASEQALNESLIRLEAKIDVVLSRHEGKIDDLTRRQGEQSAVLRDHDSRITANALTTAETRAQVSALSADVKAVEQTAKDRSNGLAGWAAVIVAIVAVVLSPILTALLTH